MPAEVNALLVERLRRRLKWITLALVVAPAVAFVCASVVPISAQQQPAQASQGRQLKPLPNVGENLSPLLEKVVGTELIRPSQVKAAVKDDGAAAKLLTKLKLQGVIQSGSLYIAYIQVEQKSVKTVHKGDKILEFTVDDVEPGKVSLSLNGVSVELGN